MADRGGRRGHGILIVLACACAGLAGQFLMYGALVSLGILLPYTSYAYNYQLAGLTAVLVMGVGLAAGGILVMAVSRGARAAGTLTGPILVPFGISVALAACGSAASIPIGASPGTLCDPGEAIVGFVLSMVGAMVCILGLFRLRPRKAM